MIEYEYKNTFVHKVSPIGKLIYLFLSLSLAFLIQNPTKEIILLPAWIIITIFFWIKAKIKVKKLKNLGIFLGVICVVIILIEGFLYRYGTLTPLFKIGDFYFLGKNIGEFTLEGLMVGLGVCLRVLCIVISVPLFVMTTSPEELGFSFSNLGLPKNLVVIFLVGISFIPTVQKSYSEIIDAYKLKGIYKKNVNFIKRLINVYLSLPIPLFLSLLQKGVITQISLETRAFGSSRKITPIFLSKISKVKSLIFCSIFGILYLLLLFLNFSEIIQPK